MYSDEKNKKAKIGKVRVDFSNNRYRLRFTYPKGNRNSIRIDCDWDEALRIAKIIQRDIVLNDVDLTYARYSSKHHEAYQQQLEVVADVPNLIEIWDIYTRDSKERISETTKKRFWDWYKDTVLGKLPSKLLRLQNAQQLINHLNSKYATSTVRLIVRNGVNPSVNHLVNQKKLESNPFLDIPLPPKIKKPIVCYELEELMIILEAFRSNKYKYYSSYHANYIHWQILTGCRPSESLALRVSDIKQKRGKPFVVINKAYAVGILKNKTKTGEIRTIPINKDIDDLLSKILKRRKPGELLFPSKQGKYLRQTDLNTDFWNTTIKGLITDGLLEERYNFYSMRHSFITRLVRSGMDIATVARLSGNSPKTIFEHYLKSNDSLDIPEL